jgi:hypothetical protein
MGPPVTRQDVQNIVENSRNRIFERVSTKQDINVLADTVRQLANLQQLSQQMLKQSEYQRLQLTRRAAAVEARLISIESELRAVRGSIDKMSGLKQQPIILPAPVANEQERQTPATQSTYVYRPN